MERENKNTRVIDCRTMAASISALHDGERILPEEAQHIAECAECSRRLREYSEMGAELRLLSARTVPSIATLSGLPSQSDLTARRGWRWPALLTGRTVIPRAVAAAAAFVIIALSISFAVFVVHAQVEGPWVQLSFTVTPDRANGARGMTGIVQSTGTPRGAFVIRGATEAVAFTLRTVEVREATAHVEVGVRGFSTPINVRTAKELVKQIPPKDYWLIPGQTIQIPVEGIGLLSVNSRISEARSALEVWNDPPVADDQLRLDRPVVLRGKEVILEGAGGTVSATVGQHGALTYYVPGEGRLLIALEPFENAIEGVADGSVMQFQESGVNYRIFSRQAITGGDQPRRIWIRHDAGYLPSVHGGDDARPSLSAGGIEKSQ